MQVAQEELPKRHGFVTEFWSLNQTWYRYIRRRVDEKRACEDFGESVRGRAQRQRALDEAFNLCFTPAVILVK